MKTALQSKFQSITLFLLSVSIIAGSGILFHMSPIGKSLEHHMGLPLLYLIRGEQQVPEQVAIISLDRESQNSLNISSQLRKWPRALHAELIHKLKLENINALGYDIFFRERKNPESDIKFANAIKESNKVILFQYIKIDRIINRGEQNSVINFDSLINPLIDFSENSFTRRCKKIVPIFSPLIS